MAPRVPWPPNFHRRVTRRAALYCIRFAALSILNIALLLDLINYLLARKLFGTFCHGLVYRLCQFLLLSGKSIPASFWKTLITADRLPFRAPLLPH